MVVIFSFFENSSVSMFSYESKPMGKEPIGKAQIKDAESLNFNISGM